MKSKDIPFAYDIRYLFPYMHFVISSNDIIPFVECCTISVLISIASILQNVQMIICHKFMIYEKKSFANLRAAISSHICNILDIVEICKWLGVVYGISYQ